MRLIRFLVVIGSIGACATLPLWVTPAALSLATQLLVVLALAQLWSLLAGHLGVFLLGQHGFLGIGITTVVVGIVQFKLSPPLSLLLAFGVGFFIAAAMAFGLQRLTASYFALASLIGAEAMHLAAVAYLSLPRVITAAPSIEEGSSSQSPRTHFQPQTKESEVDLVFLPKDWATDWNAHWLTELPTLHAMLTPQVAQYWMLLATTVLIILGIWLLFNHRLGAVIHAFGENKLLAASYGLRIRYIRLSILALFGGGAALIGAWVQVTSIELLPTAANFDVIGGMLIIAMVSITGGTKTLEGPIIGVIVYYLLGLGVTQGLGGSETQHLLSMAAVTAGVVLLAPQGLSGVLLSRFPWLREAAITPSRFQPGS